MAKAHFFLELCIPFIRVSQGCLFHKFYHEFAMFVGEGWV